MKQKQKPRARSYWAPIFGLSMSTARLTSANYRLEVYWDAADAPPYRTGKGEVISVLHHPTRHEDVTPNGSRPAAERPVVRQVRLTSNVRHEFGVGDRRMATAVFCR